MIEWLDTTEEHDRLTWTLFWDMHSGGYTKVGDYDKIYIQAPKHRAVEIFEEKFGRSPYGSACHCCGEDYAIYEYDDGLAHASAFHRRVTVADDGFEAPMPDLELYGLRPLKLTEYCEQDTDLVLYTRARGEEI
jgi:hypothetical protein